MLTYEAQGRAPVRLSARATNKGKTVGSPDRDAGERGSPTRSAGGCGQSLCGAAAASIATGSSFALRSRGLSVLAAVARGLAVLGLFAISAKRPSMLTSSNGRRASGIRTARPQPRGLPRRRLPDDAGIARAPREWCPGARCPSRLRAHARRGGRAAAARLPGASRRGCARTRDELGARGTPLAWRARDASVVTTTTCGGSRGCRHDVRIPDTCRPQTGRHGHGGGRRQPLGMRCATPSTASRSTSCSPANFPVTGSPSRSCSQIQRWLANGSVVCR